MALQNVSISELARRVKVSRGSLSRMLDGHYKMDVDLLPQVAEALGINPALLVVPSLLSTPAATATGEPFQYVTEDDLDRFWENLSPDGRQYLIEMESLRKQYRERIGAGNDGRRSVRSDREREA